MIKIRNDNYEKYYDILSYRSNDFFIPEKSDRISSFCFPFVSKDKYTHGRLLTQFEIHGIEYGIPYSEW